MIVAVTGANRGIGLAVVRQVAARGDTAILTARDPSAASAAAARLTGTVGSQQLDVTDAASVERFAAWVDAEYGRLDVLVDNAQPRSARSLAEVGGGCSCTA